VTNNHVVEGVSSVEVTTDNGKVYTAKVVGADAAILILRILSWRL